MKLDRTSFAFNLNVREDGGQPSWSTSLGTGSGYRITREGHQELLTSMVFTNVNDFENVECSLGRGGGNQDGYEFVLCSLYSKIFVNDKLIPGAKFMLLLLKQLTGYHTGRRILKYSPRCKYHGENINEECLEKIKSYFSIYSEGAWFISDIYTCNEDELHFKAYICNKSEPLIFDTKDKRAQFITETINANTNYNDTYSPYIGKNLIVYGAPGCGKSYFVMNSLLSGMDEQLYERTTFYQDYTNTDFVGQVLPKVEGDSITYEFFPGPFTLALEKALKNPTKKVALVIEELNRGNAASIFGDIFQLLDRDETGESVYAIRNNYIRDYINNQFGYEVLNEIKIPHNLDIFATMNSGDQNVFTLDTAFKRRWIFKKMRNSFNYTDESGEHITHPYKDMLVPTLKKGSEISWEELVTKINEYMSLPEFSINSEDKQIGIYFVSEKYLCTKDELENVSHEKASKFAFKVIEYIWDDVAKYRRDRWFNNVSSLDEAIDKYVTEGVEGVFNKDVFKR